jgi:hypothetical protein
MHTAYLALVNGRRPDTGGHSEYLYQYKRYEYVQ